MGRTKSVPFLLNMMCAHIENEPADENGTQWWEREALRFSCKQCGNCCGGEPGAIWINAQEKKSIAVFLGISESELRTQYLTRNMGRNSIKELENYDCIFLKRNQNRCAIYNVRPMQCKLFPFWPSILRDKNIWNYYATRCPGMNNGELFTKEMIYDLQKIDIWQDL